MKTYIDKPVLITGIERSGSSIIARIINLCGVWKGNTTVMYENTAIKDILTRLYEEMSADPLGQYPLPDIKGMEWRQGIKPQIQEQLINQGYKDLNLWLYKSNKIIQLWSLFREIYPEAKWIIVRRRSADIIDSCEKTAFMNAFEKKSVLKEIQMDNSKDGWLWWIHEHEKLFGDLVQSGANVKEIWPERMVQGDYKQIFEMIDWLGLKWNNSIVNQVESMLWKSRIKMKGN